MVDKRDVAVFGVYIAAEHLELYSKNERLNVKFKPSCYFSSERCEAVYRSEEKSIVFNEEWLIKADPMDVLKCGFKNVYLVHRSLEDVLDSEDKYKSSDEIIQAAKQYSEKMIELFSEVDVCEQ